jgi:response regulator RpfG family c-di-GMP phosphodiesterase
MTYKILIVDDEPANLRLMERLFRRDYQVLTALSGREALDLLKQHDIALIISDQRMPGMTGIEFLKSAAETRPQTVRIILTGYTDVNALVEAINSGVVYKYVTKPWLNEDLQQTVKRGLETYEAGKRLHNLALINERLTGQLKNAQEVFVQMITNALNAKDEDALGRARRASGYAAAIGSHLKCLTQDEIEQLSLAALLHNVGRIGTPAHVFKTAALTAKERRMYGERTEKILTDFPGMTDIGLAIKYYRENFDGSGSPEGLRGEQIPLFSRIISVAAVYDEMTSEPTVDKELLCEKALTKLREGAGSKFDPTIVEALCEIDAMRKASEPVEQYA